MLHVLLLYIVTLTVLLLHIVTLLVILLYIVTLRALLLDIVTLYVLSLDTVELLVLFLEIVTFFCSSSLCVSFCCIILFLHFVVWLLVEIFCCNSDLCVRLIKNTSATAFATFLINSESKNRISILHKDFVKYNSYLSAKTVLLEAKVERNDRSYLTHSFFSLYLK